jgi:hypothetical protein
MSTGWRVWLAFEVRPGITAGALRDDRALWRPLAASCRTPDGKLDATEFDRWLDCLTDRPHAWGHA